MCASQAESDVLSPLKDGPDQELPENGVKVEPISQYTYIYVIVESIYMGKVSQLPLNTQEIIAEWLNRR